MFKALIEVFRKADLLQEAYNASIEMLKLDQQMFEAAHVSLRKSDNGEMAIDIYAQDAKINEYERDVRRKVLAHLVATPSRDITFGLILISIVIDIERIGDYTKNMVELAQVHPQKLLGGEFEEEIVSVENSVSDRFRTIIEAFKNSNVEAARSIMLKHRDITQRCDGIVNSLLGREHPEFSTIDAVAVALYARYLKRISSHVTNIASGIVNPFDRIGFKE